MFFKLILLLIITTVNSFCENKPYYWRVYEEFTPHDALSTEDDKSEIFVGRIPVCDNQMSVTYYPATFNSTNKIAVTFIHEMKRVFYNNIMILCTSEPKRLRWKYINSVALHDRDILNKLVPVGKETTGITYIGKVFHENEWKISTVYAHNRPGLYIWSNVDGKLVIAPDFQVLMFEWSPCDDNNTIASLQV
ncbi:uncharacterized protein [Onthophagus taurus]|uniref:uncharacterized protein n=1 Tax=Onthophagus taurus TaxID=166361 RepID=UPI0039BDAF54